MPPYLLLYPAFDHFETNTRMADPKVGTEGCSDSLCRGKLPSAASPSARLLFQGSPRACRSPDSVPSRPYSRCVGRPAFIDASDRGKLLPSGQSPIGIYRLSFTNPL